MKTVLSYLENTASKFPQKTAVMDETGSCTYLELLENSRRIGSALAEKISPRAPVAVFMEKSMDTVFGFFGILWAGGFYSLLSPDSSGSTAYTDPIHSGSPCRPDRTIRL